MNFDTSLLLLLIPLAGTFLGATCVFFLKKNLGLSVERGLLGFAAGVMVAASVWSLLIPAMEMHSSNAVLSMAMVVAGFWAGILFLLLLDHVIPHLHNHGQEDEGPKSKLKRTTKLVLAVTLHNIPEGMAVGVTYAGWMSGSQIMTFSGALALVIGIAVQNFPEGAIISLPLRSEGMSKPRAFLYGVLSGVVEPAAALITILLVGFVTPYMPFLLSLAAGAMIYVVVEELIPEMAAGGHSNVGTIMFAVGFSLMMALDVLLG